MPTSLTFKSGKTVLQINKNRLHPPLATTCATAGPDTVELNPGLVFLVSITLISFPSQISVLDAHCILYGHVSNIVLL